MNAVVVANGDLHPDDTQWMLDADLLVAADGGAHLTARAGRLPSVIAGDLDSMEISSDLRAAIADQRVVLESRPSDKDETDTELALAAALARGARRVDVIGAFGGPRIDHEIANLLMLADPQYRGVQLSVVHGRTRVRAIHGGDDLVLDGATGDTVSLLPIGGDAVGVRTDGLAYVLRGDTLRFARARGVSNRIVEQPARVHLDQGVMLVVELAAEGGSA